MPRKQAQTGTDEFSRLLGARLRTVRNATGMSLDTVAARSGGRFTAVAVGTYERGDRAVSVRTLAGLAEFYGTDLADLLPPESRRRQAGAPTALEKAAAALRDAAQALADAREEQRAQAGDRE